jgi:hypothetical protein
MLMPLTDLHKIYIDDESYHSGHGHAYEFYGVDPEKGAIGIIRPDNCKWYHDISHHILIIFRRCIGS